MKTRRLSYLSPALLALLLLPSLAAAQGAPAGSAAEEVRQLEERRFAAMVRADVKALGPMLADDLTYGHSSGELETKAQFLAGLSSGNLRYRVIRPSTIDVRVYGDVAVGTGMAEIEATAGGQELAVTLRYTDVYVKRDGRWQMVAWQSTRLPQQERPAAANPR